MNAELRRHSRTDDAVGCPAAGAPGHDVRPGVPEARPLYLMSPRRCVVDIDGPALAVSRERRATVRYPLARVSRIVCAASIEWRARAVTSCLERAIPIVILNAAGAPVGYVQPTVPVRSSLDRLLTEFLERSDWREQYDNWLRAERMRAVQSWISHRSAAGRPVDATARREVIRQFVYGQKEQPASMRDSLYSAALMALSCAYVRKAGVAAVYTAIDGTELSVAVDVCRLLELALELELQGMGEQLDITGRETIYILETYSEGLERRCAHILGRLFRRAQELLREWH